MKKPRAKSPPTNLLAISTPRNDPAACREEAPLRDAASSHAALNRWHGGTGPPGTAMPSSVPAHAWRRCPPRHAASPSCTTSLSPNSRLPRRGGSAGDVGQVADMSRDTARRVHRGQFSADPACRPLPVRSSAGTAHAGSVVELGPQRTQDATGRCLVGSRSAMCTRSASFRYRDDAEGGTTRWIGGAALLPPDPTAGATQHAHGIEADDRRPVSRPAVRSAACTEAGDRV